MKNKLGSNQFEVKYKYNFVSSVLILAAFLALVAVVGYYNKPQPMISPLPRSFMPTIVKVVEASPGDPVIDYISFVFRKEGTRVVGKMISCAYGESKFNTDAYNYNTDGSDDLGIFQINSKHGYSIEDRRNYKKNIQMAYKIYKTQGLRAWYHP